MCHYDMYVKVAYKYFNNKRRYDDEGIDLFWTIVLVSTSVEHLNSRCR